MLFITDQMCNVSPLAKIFPNNLNLLRECLFLCFLNITINISRYEEMLLEFNKLKSNRPSNNIIHVESDLIKYQGHKPLQYFYINSSNIYVSEIQFKHMDE